MLAAAIGHAWRRDAAWLQQDYVVGMSFAWLILALGHRCLGASYLMSLGKNVAQSCVSDSLHGLMFFYFRLPFYVPPLFSHVTFEGSSPATCISCIHPYKSTRKKFSYECIPVDVRVHNLPLIGGSCSIRIYTGTYHL